MANLRTLITQCGSNESTISGAGLTLGTINLPQLVHAEFRTGGLWAANARSIAAAAIPKIERLDIWYGDENYGGNASVDDVVPLLQRTDLPALRHLGLMNALRMTWRSPSPVRTCSLSSGCSTSRWGA